MRSVFFFFMGILAYFGAPALQASSDTSRLIEGCQELTEIYSSHDQERFLAAATTSLSEAMRAGYCLGTLTEFKRHFKCPIGDTYQLAARIAELPDWHSDTAHMDTLLVNACGQ